MNGRQRIAAAMSEAGTVRTPAVICYEPIYVRDHWRQLCGSRPWWHAESPDLQTHLAWQREMVEKTGQDWFIVPPFYSHEARRDLTIELIDDRPVLLSGSAGRARELEPQPSVDGLLPRRFFGIELPRRVQPPGPQDEPDIDRAIPSEAEDHFDPAGFIQAGHADLARQLIGQFADLYPYHIVSSPLWQCNALWGYEGTMVQLMDRPDLVRYACEKTLRRAHLAVRRAAALGAQAIWIEECSTDAISPRMYAEFNLPLVRSLVQAIGAAGMKSIYYYCGSPWDRFELLMSAGADAIAFEEGKKGFEIDIERVVDQVQGRCTVLGNLDALQLLERGSDADLAAEIARQLAAGRRNRGRFIMSLGSPVTPGTGVKRVKRYCNLVRELADS